MRILYLIDEIRNRGGAEGHLWALAHGMADRGHEVMVLSLDEGPPFGPDFRNITAFHYDCLHVERIYDWTGVKAFARLVGQIRRMSPQVVQTFHTASDLIGPLAAIVAMKGSKRVSSRRDLGYTKSDRHIRFQRLVNHLVNCVLGNSLEVVRAAREREQIPEGKLRVIHNGIKTAGLEGIGRRPSDGTIRLGTVANLRKVKGIDVLLRAMGSLAGLYPALRCEIAGDGEEREALTALAVELGIAERVKFLGTIQQIPEFLSRLDIYAQPSLGEGFSNSVLEAMAAGLPVITTRVGGNLEIIEDGETGLLVEPGDWAGLADAIRQLAGDGDCRAVLGAAGRAKVLANFTLPVMLDHYEAFYQELISKN